AELGPYVRAERGDFVIPPDVLEPLRIGTAQDKDRVSQRRSNWYISRPCVDTRTKDEGRPGRFTSWQMNVFYYTGVVDKVPHIPDACLVAGGAGLIGTSPVKFTVPGLTGAWGKDLLFNRTVFSRKNGATGPASKHVQYYIFAFNGEPESSQLAVRRKLTYPWIDHSYFAKIEMAPNAPIEDMAEADKAAEEFLRYFLPIVLKALPSRDDINRLDRGERD
ncbi:MAG: hypothetical protein J7M14_07280, partial [Planctomycetes bacterium]|nr:hypothetical protein [Planctomycetota bacterium]